MESCAGRDAYQDAFFLGDFLALCECIVIFYRDDLVIDLGVESVRNESSTDSLDLMSTALAFREDPENRLVLLQRLSRPDSEISGIHQLLSAYRRCRRLQ